MLLQLRMVCLKGKVQSCWNSSCKEWVSVDAVFSLLNVVNEISMVYGKSIEPRSENTQVGLQLMIIYESSWFTKSQNSSSMASLAIVRCYTSATNSSKHQLKLQYWFQKRMKPWPILDTMQTNSIFHRLGSKNTFIIYIQL